MVDALDTLVPTRSEMPKVTREIFNSGRYCVTDTRKGLIVQNHRTGKGIIMPTSHPQYAQWLDAFETAIDAEETHLLCNYLTRAQY